MSNIPVKPVVVEDSVTHQAGDGITAGHAQAAETPDIFDNRAQPAVKQASETVPAEVVAAANANNVSIADVATEGSTITTPSDNINPNGGGSIARSRVSVPDTVVTKQTVIVEDSVTHQAGDGITAGHAEAAETPDIFDNNAQPAVKKKVAAVPVATVEPVIEPTVATTQELIKGANDYAPKLQTLSDGSVDIPRE